MSDLEQDTETINMEVESPGKDKTSKEKIVKPGIIYLESVPNFMTVRTVRETLSGYDPNKRRIFKEGWVEFRNRKDARRTANHLHGKQVGLKRNAPYYYSLWSMKYLR
ncbi:ABT1, partial [Cordylochernes scorpioides]